MKEQLTKFWIKVFAAVMLLTTNTVFAALPSVQDPNASDGIIGQMKNYSSSFIDFLGLGVCAIGFTAVAWYGIAVYSDVQKGKKTWAELGMCIGVGAIILVAAIWFLNQATGVLN